MEIVIDLNEPYCHQCGSDSIAYIEQFAAKVKEQCAQVCESMSGSDYSPKQCASAIRAIKDLPK